MERKHREGYLRKPPKRGEFTVWKKEQVWGEPWGALCMRKRLQGDETLAETSHNAPPNIGCRIHTKPAYRRVE